MRNLIGVLFFLSFVLTAAAEGQGVWGERGIVRRLVPRGTLIYAADGRGVSVYDAADPRAIRRIDVESGDEESLDLAFAGANDLFVATAAGVEHFRVASDGTIQRLDSNALAGAASLIAATPSFVATASGRTLRIFDTNLQLLHEISLGDAIRALTVSGSMLYVAVKRAGIAVIDATSGEMLASVPVDAAALDLEGTTLWAVAEIRGLFAIDVASPGEPRIAGMAGAAEFVLTGVVAAGSRVYAIEAPDRVHVFDGSDRQAPRRIATLTEWVRVAATGEGNRLYLSGAIVDEEELSFETGAPLQVFDVTTPAAPAKLGEFRDLAGPISGVWTDGSIAYVVDAPYLRVLDISKTAEPREIAAVLAPNVQEWIRVRDKRLINYGRVWVNLFDLANPRRPRYLGSWHTQGHAPSTAALARDTFVEANGHSGLHVVDYSDPSRPVQIAGRIFHYHDLAAGDDAIYALQQAIFLTADISDRTRVADRTIHTSGEFIQLDTAPPNAAFPHHVVLRSGRGLFTYSLEQDRFAPKEIGFAPLTSPGLLATSDTSVFVAKDGLLYRLELADPTKVTPTDMVVTSPMQISVAGEKVVVADRFRLRVWGPDTPPPPAQRTRRRAVGIP